MHVIFKHLSHFSKDAKNILKIVKFVAMCFLKKKVAKSSNKIAKVAPLFAS